MSIKEDEKQNTQGAKVLQLGFNISVSGDPGTDFQIVLDDTGQKATPSISQNDTRLPSLDILPKKHSEAQTSKKELEIDFEEVEEVETIENKSIKSKGSKDTLPKIKEPLESSYSKESNIIKEIKSTLEHFEKLSDHLKDVPRLRGHPAATSTPLSDKNNSKSESNLLYPEFRHRRFHHLHDYYYKKHYYFNKAAKPPDIFLKPLPGENLYRSGFYTKYTTDSLRHYVSDSSLNKTSDYKVVCEKSKCDDFTLETPGILKKPDSESGDKQSTSSAESIKDIKIYQSGGVLILQNFKDNMDAFEKKEISNFSAKLIENCSRLREEVNSFQGGNTKGTGISSEEGKNSVKMVQFDLSGFENQKSKSRDSSFNASKDEKLSLKQGSSDSISDSTKNKESSPQGTSQSQDFPSLSTVENESTFSNQFGVSPTYSSTKKLEWDSGADVGYCNSDLSKENLSTIEKYVLSHLSSGTYTDNESEFSKFAKVRIASDKLMNEIREERKKEQQEIMIIEKRSCEHEVEVVELSGDEPVNNVKVGNLKDKESRSMNEISMQKHPESKPKAVISSDKSVNVNTLFENVNLIPSNRTTTSEEYKKVDASNKKSSKVRKFRKSKPSPRKITWAPQKRRFSCENLNSDYQLPVFGMGVPKRTYKKVDGNPKIRDLELSREVEEIVIDQRFKIKQNLSSSREIKKPSAGTDEKENKSKRPVSGSSSSNNTVLPNVENKEAEKGETMDVNKVSDQIMQKVGLDCESVGVQAFESQKSDYFSSKTGDEQPKAPEMDVNVQLSSKNIQAFGLNASLPKELSHLKETNFFENQHSKSTQFFGGPINSLPNYHSGLVTKPAESCSRLPKILKTKKTAEAEIIRLNEENKRNILANDSQKTSSKSGNAKNKENLFSKNSRSLNSVPQKNRDTSEKKDIEGTDLQLEKRSSLTEDFDNIFTSDEISSKILTSEVLKEHGDSIDRNIIQEKYFQSQLIELKKREMISRSTSVDSQIEGERVEKECLTVGCEYSSRSRDTTSEEELKDIVPEEKSKQKSQRTETTDQYDSSLNIMEEELICTSKNTNKGQVTGYSLPSSTQTAHSWIPGVQNPEQDKSGVGRARSFEYLPGHIYESGGNLREQLPSETEQTLMTGSSSESDSGKQSSKESKKDSEGRNTLILENSTDDSHESDQLKILDENLTQLNLVVSKLWEKEAEVKKINQSLFLNLRFKNGSGDHIEPKMGKDSCQILRPFVVKLLMRRNRNLFEKYLKSSGNTDTLQTEVIQGKNIKEDGIENGDSNCLLSAHVEKKTKEVSTGCQTEEKSSTNTEKFYQKRKSLEKRISEEKKNQIKWIENEIHHLNILRGLLEEQSFSQQRKKLHSSASETHSDMSKIESDHPNSNLNENHSVPVTPVYGCTISLARNSLPAENRPTSEGSSSESQREHVNAINSDPVQYGMSVSLRNVAMNALQNFQRVVTLPVGVQISLKGSGSGRDRLNSREESENAAKTNLKSRPTSPGGLPRESMPCRHCRVPQNEVCTQFPSSRKNSVNLPSTSVQTDFSPGKCNQCQRKNCFCLSLSVRSLHSTSHSSKVSERRESLRCSLGNEELLVENKTSSSTDRELLELESDPSPKSDKSTKVLVKSDDKSGSSGHSQKPKCSHKNDCRKHLELVHSPPVKSGIPGVVCQNPCLSNTTSISDKSDVFLSCRCSKVHVKKYSTCSCHVIKIMGTKCSAGSGTCRCKKRNSKTTENQSCQTDQVTIVTKDLVETPELIKASRAQCMDTFSEKKIAIEKKTSVLQKLPKDHRISFDRRRPCDKKLEVQEKVAFVKKSPEIGINAKNAKNLQAVSLNCTRSRAEEKELEIDKKVGECPEDDPVGTKALRPDRICTCWETFKKKVDTNGSPTESIRKETAVENYCVDALRETPSVEEDNHPRHYFLKIEETEIDDSKDSFEMKNSLEVITVKVPVKKAGKAKINNPKYSKSYQSDRYGMNSNKEVPKSCNCCQTCRGHSQKSIKYNTSGECRVQAEKPQSPVRFSAPHPTPVTSLDDVRYQYMYDKYHPYEKRFSSMRTDCYCERLANSQDCGFKKDIQTEYDSHKKYKCNSKSNVESNSCEKGRNQGRRENVQSNQWCEVDEIQLSDQETACNTQGARRCSDDYFNYDRTEYKTKSELLKEEEKKQKIHQLSLQEYLCKNRPDFYNTAERRRQVITEKARERIIKHNNRMECLMNLIHCCSEGAGERRIFTTSEMRGQTMKRYKKLPEVTGKIASQKKKEEYRTNKLVADIYSKKLQIEALKGHLNLSNSISVLATI